MTDKKSKKSDKVTLYKNWMEKPVVVVLTPETEEELDHKLSEIFEKFRQRQRHQHRFNVKNSQPLRCR